MIATKTTKEQLPALSMTPGEVIEVLRNSLYPGAQDASIKMVMAYCSAAGLDVMQKPVHIVPMWCSKSKQMRDVIMPGIGSYRTQAARSGEYAGVSDPEFGDDITESLSGLSITYPKWCRVVVKRSLPNGSIAEFSAKELWKENYATAGKESIAPNAMWKRRPYAQLAKCAEAQSLRKAFPEFGAQPTADEMEGKIFDDSLTTIDNATGEIITTPQLKELPNYPDEQLDKNIAGWQKTINEGRKTTHDIVAMISTRYKLSVDQARQIYDLKKEEPKQEPMTDEANDFVSAMEDAEK